MSEEAEPPFKKTSESMTTLTELLALAYKLGQEDGWERCINHQVQQKKTKDKSVCRGITRLCCEHFELNRRQITGQGRKKKVAEARMITMFLIRRHVKISLKEVGALFGGRDHTTVIHACQTILDLISTDDRLFQEVVHLDRVINQSLFPDKALIKIEPEIKPIVKLEPKVISMEKAKPAFHRPPASYTNLSGHLKLINELS